MKNNASLTGLAIDAVVALGFGEESMEPLPEPEPDEIVMKVGGWSLQELRDCNIGKKLMSQQHWYDKIDWMAAKLTPGIYRVRLPVPNSNNLPLFSQSGILLPDEKIGPVALCAATWLAVLSVSGKNLLTNIRCRCAEMDPNDTDAVIGFDESGAVVSWAPARCDNVFVCGAREA